MLLLFLKLKYIVNVTGNVLILSLFLETEDSIMLKLKPDFEECEKRYKAFWKCGVTDRPLVTGMTFKVDNPLPVPEKEYDKWEDKWTDIDFRVNQTVIELQNNVYYDDTLPTVFPNMGPEIFSAWCGCSYNFGEMTTWSEPCIMDWETDYNKAALDMEHPLFKLLENFTRKLLDAGKGNFITGLTDFHPGADHLAALRDPANLAIDLIENPGWVKKKLKESQEEYYKAYDHFYNIIRAYNIPITTWNPLIAEGKYYLPSNDFSCMISNDMFEEFFLDGIIEECRFYDNSIYHLDGPGALKHLDSLLSIKELDAIQWVPGAGNEGFERWIPVYKKIQNAGKGIQIFGVNLENLDLLFENLKPEGAWICGVGDIKSREEADYALKRIKNWN
jgi:hypothetical protein